VLEREINQLQIEQQALKLESDELSKSKLLRVEKELGEKLSVYDDLNAVWIKEKAMRGEIQATKEKLEEAEKTLEKAQLTGKFDVAGRYKYQVIPKLKKSLDAAKTDESMLPDSVTDDDIAKVVSKATGIPVSKLRKGERQRLLHMEENLQKRVVGQDHATACISDSIRISRAGLHSHTKPVGSFIFLGQSGVGKTELAKALAEFMFDDENRMTRIDMSEYSERHSISRLIGAPPGYVGYDEGGMLTEAVRRRAYQVLLLDEAEKAHREVCNVLLQVLDEGFLTDSQGRKVDFRNTVVILTSNLGASELDGISNVDQAVREEVHMNALRSHFPPEFINRLDEIIVFNTLEEKHLEKIAEIMIANIKQQLLDGLGGAQSLYLEVDDNLREKIVGKASSLLSRYGARPLKRVLYRDLLKPLAKFLLESGTPGGATIRASVGQETEDTSFSIVQKPVRSTY